MYLLDDLQPLFSSQTKIATGVALAFSSNVLLSLAAKPLGHYFLQNRAYPEPLGKQIKYAVVTTVGSVAGLAATIAISLVVNAIKGFSEDEISEDSEDSKPTNTFKLMIGIYFLTEALNLASGAAVAYWRSNEFNQQHDDDDFNSAKMSDLWCDFASGFTILFSTSMLLFACCCTNPFKQAARSSTPSTSAPPVMRGNSWLELTDGPAQTDNDEPTV